MNRALITGASRGIGKAVAELFGRSGLQVCAPARSQMDLSSSESIEAFMASAGEFDILVNCAGVNDLASIDEMTPQKLSQMLQVNLQAQALLIKLVSAGMKRRGYGRIVNFSSIWCDFSKERRIMYSVAKAGVKGLTVAAAVELAKYDVLVNAVAPGFVNTEMTSRNNTPAQIQAIAQALPIKRLAEPSEIAELVYFLASEKNTFITGQTIFADGGFSCV